MEHLTSLIHNFNCDYHKQYTNVSRQLGNRLDETLKEVEDFYYNPLWEQRFIRRLREEGYAFDPIELARIQGSASCLREDTQFKIFDEDPDLDGVSDRGTMIALNTNMTPNELNDSHINNVVMHEFGHRQYNQKEFKIVDKLNRLVIRNPGNYIRDDQKLNKKDYKYFTDHNELRQRIIPVIKEMFDNNWTAEDAYYLSENLQQDSITEIFTKKYLIYLLNNIL